MTDDPEITDPRDPYKRPDIVAELDRWLVSRASLREATVSHALLQAARDEIVALRGYRDECERQFQEQVAATGRLFDRLWLARAEALEEAAQACVGSGAIVAEARLCASGHPRAEGTSTMSDTSDPLEILNAIDRERGESFIGMIQANQVQRLRDEIVAMRKMTDGDWVWKQITDTRDAALEEAATTCLRKARDYVIPIGQDNYHDGCVSCAAAIRALREK